MYKTCSKCGETKNESEYHKHSNEQGLRPDCKVCRSKQQSDRYLRNKEKILKTNAAWREKNKERSRELIRSHYRKNKQYYTARNGKRRARFSNATPTWLTKKQIEAIEREYKIAALLSEATGYSWHVDHIIPLKGNNVSGLHIPENLRVIPAFLNWRKGNSFNFN